MSKRCGKDRVCGHGCANRFVRFWTGTRTTLFPEDTPPNDIVAASVSSSILDDGWEGGMLASLLFSNSSIMA